MSEYARWNQAIPFWDSVYACTAFRCSAGSGCGRDEGLTPSLPTLVLGIEAKTFWQGPCRWTSYPAPYGFPDSASLKGDKDCNLKFFIDTLKFTAVLCLGERYWPIFLDANWIPSLSPCLFFLVPVIPLVCTQIFLQFCSFENITHHGMRLNKEFW